MNYKFVSLAQICPKTLVDSTIKYMRDLFFNLFSLKVFFFSDIIPQTSQILFMYDECIYSYINAFSLIYLPELSRSSITLTS